MSESRHKSDQLLKATQTDEENRNKGHLKIFFSDMRLVWVKPTPCWKRLMAKQQELT